MGLFDDVTLQPEVELIVRDQYPGKHTIPPTGWQTKSLGCQMTTAILGDNSITYAGDALPRFTGAIQFYQAAGDRTEGDREWLEFIAVYVDSKLIAIRHVPET